MTHAGLGQIELSASAWVARAPDGVVRRLAMNRVPIDRGRAHLSGLDPAQLLCRTEPTNQGAQAGDEAVFGAELMLATLRHVSSGDDGAWNALAHLTPIDPSWTARDLGRRLFKQQLPMLLEVELHPNEDLARTSQDVYDASMRAMRLEQPWLFDPDYDGDFGGAPWAHDPSGRIAPFPAGFYEDPDAGLLVLQSLHPDPPMGNGTRMFVKPFPEGQARPPTDQEPISVPVYVVAAGGKSRAAIRKIADGTAQPTTHLLVGPREQR